MSNNSTLFVRDLIFSGVHGSTGRETTDLQRFKLNMEIFLDTSKAEQTDLLVDTYDYNEAIEIARSVIEGEHQVLLEKIARKIAEKICVSPKIHSVKIQIEKIDSFQNGLPGVILTHKKALQETAT